MAVGVITRTETRSGPVSPPTAASARYMVSGLAERGATGAPTLVKSLTEFVRLFGPRVGYSALYDDLRVFFEEGGGDALVVRVVGDDATVGSATLVDRAALPEPTLSIEARSEGAWSTGLKVTVLAGTNAGTYRVQVRHAGELVHNFDNLTTPADAVAAANNSPWVRIVDLGSETATPGNQPALGEQTLAAGTDDRASVTAAQVAGALDLIGEEQGTGAVACPGYTSAQVGALLKEHARIHDRVVILATEREATLEDAKLAAANLLSPTDGEYATLVYPWVVIPDGPTSKAVPPTGYAAACRARAHRESGAWQHPGGERAEARFILGPDKPLTRSQSDDLHENWVSAVRTVVGTTRLYGWRSLSTDVENYPDLNQRDLLNFISVEAEKALETYTFSTIDGRGQVLGRIQSTLVGLVDPIRAAGGIFERIVDGQTIDRGYTVDVGEDVNPGSQLVQNKVAAVLAVRPSPTSSLIELTIVKAGLTAAV